MDEQFKKIYEKQLNQYTKAPTAKSAKIAKAFAVYESAVIKNQYDYDAYEKLCTTLSSIYKMQLHTLESFDSFFSEDLHKALIAISSQQAADDIFEIAKLQFKGIYQTGWYRRSFRSKNIGYYTRKMIAVIHEGLHWSSYGITLKQVLEDDEMVAPYKQYPNIINGFENALALAIIKQDQEVIELVKSAIFDDETKVKVTRELIRSIIISGDPNMLEALGKLLLAAKLQEGLRQAIVENLDCGSVETASYLLKLIIDHNLYRFSSIIRALDTWTGLAFSNEKQRIVEKCIKLAYEVLHNPSACETYRNSDDVLEIYFALWGMANVEVEIATNFIQNEKDTSIKYKQLIFMYFLRLLDAKKLQYDISMQYLHSDDLEVLAWATTNLQIESLSSWESNELEKLKAKPSYYLPKDKQQRIQQFNFFASILKKIGGKKHTFKESIFPWMNIELNNEAVVSSLIHLALYDLDQELVDRCISFFKDFQVTDRKRVLIHLIGEGNSQMQRQCLRDGLSDRSATIKEMCLKRIIHHTPNQEDIQALIDILGMKSSSFKKMVIESLLKQKVIDIHEIIIMLLDTDNDEKHQAGLEMIQILSKEDNQILKQYTGYFEQLKNQEKVSQATQILLENMMVDNLSENQHTKEEGYGLYSIDDIVYTQEETVSKAKQSLFKKLLTPKKVGREVVVINDSDYANLVQGIMKVRDDYADYEYEGYRYDTKEQVLLGNELLTTVPNDRDNKRTLDDYPLADKWKAALKDFEGDAKRLALFRFYRNQENFYTTQYQLWFKKRMEPFVPTKNMNHILKTYAQTYRERRYLNIVDVYFNTIADESLFPYVFDTYKEMIYAVEQDRWLDTYYSVDNQNAYYSYRAHDKVYNCNIFEYWRDLAIRFAKSDENFTLIFNELYKEHCILKAELFADIGIQELLRGYRLKLISDDGFMRILMESRNVKNYLNRLTSKFFQQTNQEEYELVAKLVDKVVCRIVEIEANRGEVKSEVTELATQINEIKGAKYFMLLLRALDGFSFHRGYVYSGDDSKKAVLSYLLKQTHPVEADSVDVIKQLAKQFKISDKRLVEAALYVPAWASIVEEVIGWDGLHCGIWFFHAHVSEHFSRDKEAEVARYSPIEPIQFNDGAFDIEWFKQAYDRLQEERFQFLYKNAKYISDGNIQHRRSQLYVDAVLNRLDKVAMKAEIISKRNQEKLRCYALFPIESGNSDAALEVYEFIQRFKKESNQFGAQRRASEAKAVEAALANLAIATGFHDVLRMTWALEAKKFEQIASVFSYQPVGKIKVRLVVEEDQSIKMLTEKDGKILKTVPKEYAKDDYILQLKAIMKDCRSQQSRAKTILEKAMVDQTSFVAYEIHNLLMNPILEKIVTSILFKIKDMIGFIRVEENKLIIEDFNGVVTPVESQVNLLVVHPHQLIQDNVLKEYQQMCFEKEIKQPFKQIYREYYPLTSEERKENGATRRYAGHQVQPTKTIALLKSKGWTLDYDGLQKVNYKDNVIVHIMALADWFSPADIEAPTLEEVYFSDRKTNKTILLDQIDPIVFSEAMRDIDLVVSVAHVGGVDPEASHSTVEMRVAIAKQLCQLLKLDNVTFSENYAKIDGKLASYTVHLGSGVIHQKAKGMLMVLPVHSQARGRIFLPFADNDPKTAEIMSKILMFSNDNKIKDPSILEQIQK